MSVKFQNLTANIMVENVNATLKYYQEILGFSVLASVPDEDDPAQTQWANVERNEAELMFQSRKNMIKEQPYMASVPMGGTLGFYIEVEDLDTFYTEVKDKVDIIKDIHTTFYGMREFYIKDLNGYVLAFAEKEEKSD